MGANWPNFGLRIFFHFVYSALISVIKNVIFLNVDLGLGPQPPLPENRSSGSTSLISYHIRIEAVTVPAPTVPGSIF